MKKIILITLVMAALPVVSHAAGYVLANYGDGGKVHASSYGLELGGIFLSPYHPNGGAFSLGMGASIAQTDENPPSNTSGTWKYYDGNEQEICATFGAEIVPAFFGVVGIGYAAQDVRKLGHTSDTTDNNVTWMLGMRYVIQYMNIGLGYDYRRGVTASLGVAF